MKAHKPLSQVPASELQSTIDFYTRDKSLAIPDDYLKQFLRVSRQYGYATQDGSWGELEKELSIVFCRLERLQRYIDRQIHVLIINGDKREYDEIYEDLIKHGERFWEDLQEMKKMVEQFDRSA